jgi:uncharacterized phage protein (TIGR01671 family)
MREILFRGKRIDNGEYVEGYYFCSRDLHRENTHKIHPLDSDWSYEVSPSTVGEFTGLVDKNGVKVFEGDVVKHYNRVDVGYPDAFDVGVIFWNKEDFGWRRTGKIESQYIETHGYFISENSPYEVIGNIHDNPELLEANNEANMY